MADTRIKSVFGVYADQLQVLINTNADAFKPTIYRNYFDTGIPTVNLNYTTAIGKARIEAAASIVDRKAGAPMRARPDIEKLFGKVAAIKVQRKMDEDDYREMLTLQNAKVSDDIKKTQLLRLMWEDVQYCGLSVDKRVEFMCMQAMSTFKVSISKTTNPDGVVLGDIDLLAPAANTRKVKVVWGDATTATMKPIADIRAAVLAARANGISFGKVIIPEALFYIVSNCTEVVDLLKGFMRIGNGSLNPTLDQVNQFMSANRLPVFEVIDPVIGIEKDGVITNIRPWKAENVTLVPDGKLGIIHNALAMEELQPVPGITYAKYQNVLISKWFENNPFGEFTLGEWNAFPGFEQIEQCYILTTDVAI